MKTRRPDTEQQRRADHATATAKIRMWGSRADKARQAGRTADADRCDDKVRDWASKARQIEQQESRK
jgi:hypothetical protein